MSVQFVQLVRTIRTAICTIRTAVYTVRTVAVQHCVAVWKFPVGCEAHKSR